MTERAPFWSDNLSVDLLHLVDGAEEALGAEAGTLLYVHAKTTLGRLDHPSVWHSGAGLVTFAGLSPAATGKPEGFWTPSPVVECTLLELWRDAFLHTYGVLVGRRVLFDVGALREPAMRLIYSARKIARLDEGEGDRHREAVRGAMRASAELLITLKGETT